MSTNNMCSLPPEIMVNKDFLKEVLSEQKALMPLAEVKFINVPLYDELSLKNLSPQFAGVPEFCRYFPTSLPRGRQMDRSYCKFAFVTDSV